MNAIHKKRINRALDWACLLLFAVTVILAPMATFYLSEHFLQGDLSSDLVYANHLYETGRLISQDWYGSTELRIMRAEWVFAPLFAVFEDWRMVRFCGTMIMQALIVLSFGYLLRQTNARRNSFFLGASLLLVPYSFAYGVNVLYGCFYATFAAMGFFCVALVLSLVHRGEKRAVRVFKLMLLGAIGFGASLGGPRMLLNVAAPLVLTVLAMVFARGIGSREMHCPLFAAFIFAAVCAAGYLVNSRFLMQLFDFFDYDRRLEFKLFEQLDEILIFIMNNFGYQEGPLLMSKLGVISLGGAGVTLGYFAYIISAARGCCLLSSEQMEAAELNRRCIGLFAFFSMLAMLLFKVLTNEIYGNETYYLLVTIWFIPCLAMEFGNMDSLIRRGAVLLASLVLFVNGIYSMASFVLPERFPQYFGRTYHHITLSGEADGVCDFLEQEGYTFGYSTFWHANVVTEKTDGAVQMACIDVFADQETALARNYWLVEKELMDTPRERAFLLLTLEEEKSLEGHAAMGALERIYTDEHFSVYSILEPLKVYEGLIL